MTMISHVSVGVRDTARAAAFYDAVCGALGFKRVADYLPHAAGYGATAPEFWIGQPHDGGAQSAGNGTHICFAAPSRKAVDKFHEVALAHGGASDGAPGLRPEYTPDYYAAFVRDLDGNKIEAVHLPMPAAAKDGAKDKAKKVKAAVAKTGDKKKAATAKTLTKAKAKKPAPRVKPKAKAKR